MTQLIKDSLLDIVTVVERVVEVVVPATSYQVTVTGGTPEQVQRQKSGIKPKGPSRSIGVSGGGSSGSSGFSNGYSYDGIAWNAWTTNKPSPPGWVVL